MRVALLELRRKPGRFAVVGVALVLLSLLLLFLGALLDGLFLNSTGAIRSVDADGIVFSTEARESFLRSSIDAETRAEIDAVAGVAQTGGLGISLLGVAIPGEDDVSDAAVTGYELASSVLPDPPAPGDAYADRRLGEFGAQIGETVLLGPAEVPLRIIGWVDDTNYLQQNGLWVEPDTWRDVQNRNRPDAPVVPGEFQTLVVRTDDEADRAEVLAAIDTTTGATETLTETEAVFAVPGITEQEQTFTAVIGVTVFVSGLVVALFFALLTIERAGLYAVFKAIGAPSRTLVLGVVVQSTVVALVSFAIGAALTYLLAQVVPPEVPAQFEPDRIAFTLLAVLAASIIGALISLRRIVNIDPVSAIGAGV